MKISIEFLKSSGKYWFHPYKPRDSSCNSVKTSTFPYLTLSSQGKNDKGVKPPLKISLLDDIS